MKQFITINPNISKTKPNIYISTNLKCPFCDFKTLELENSIMEKHPREPIIWIKNKFPNMVDAFQTLIIESNSCDRNFSNYTLPYIQELIDFTISKRESLLNRGEFKDVLVLKNHGIKSGGSIPHGHLQIIGTKNVKSVQKLENYQGIAIKKSKNSLLTLSDNPVTELFEFNISWTGKNMPIESAQWLQEVIRFSSIFKNGKYNAYNLVYYKDGDTHYIKVIYRYYSPIMTLAFNLQFIELNLEEVCNAFLNIFPDVDV